MTYPAMKEIYNKYLHKAELSSAMEYLVDKQRTGRPIVISGI
ncbi:MAG: hypothetical protein SFU25_01520 [Candidatus Caenarcaniphilales bacterium]|nr:hypothetical protein [Candidatus Caenarcaniphilales bacterium]